MIRLLSVGVASCVSGESAPLPCAIDDAKTIYDAFAKSFYDDFDHSRSYILENPTRSILVGAIISQASSLDPNDIFVLYLSSHGDVVKSSLEIQLHDFTRDKSSGSITPDELEFLFLKTRVKAKVFILDCCFSGLAGTISQLDAHLKSNTVIVASASKNEEAKFGSARSLFTDNLAKSLYSAKEDSRVSLSSVFDNAARMTRDKNPSQNPSLFLPEGMADFVMNSQSDAIDFRSDLERVLIKKVRESSAFERKAIWSSLSEYNEKTFLNILEKYLDGNLEPLWDVRRSIGNSLASIKYLTEDQERVSDALLTPTNHWANQCVGVIGSRRFPEANTKESYLGYLSRSVPIDFKWLVLLYYTDKMSSFDIEVFNRFLAQFSNTIWGLIEVWTHFSKKIPAEYCDTVINSLFSSPSVQNEADQAMLLLYFSIYFPVEGKRIISEKRYEIPLGYRGSFSDYIETIVPRGVLNHSGLTKWLYSLLYGQWRGDRKIAMNSLLSKFDIMMFGEFSEKLKGFPSASLQVAFFEAINFTKFAPNLIFEHLLWGLSNPHPWVRRASISCIYNMFCSLSDGNKESFKRLLLGSFVSVDSKLYPGCLDLVFTYCKLFKLMSINSEDICLSFKQFLHGLGQIERNSLKMALNSEGIDGSSLIP